MGDRRSRRLRAPAHGRLRQPRGGGRGLIRTRGALAFDHSSPDYVDALRRASDGHGFDLVLEMNAGQNRTASVDLLAPRGRVMVVGSHGELAFTPRSLMGREVSVRGVMLFGMTKDERAQARAALLGLASSGALQPEVAHVLDMRDAPRAHELMTARGKRGSIVLTTRSADLAHPRRHTDD